MWQGEHTETHGTFYSIKRVTIGTYWKFEDVVVQNNSKEMYKKLSSMCKVVFFSN